MSTNCELTKVHMYLHLQTSSSFRATATTYYSQQSLMLQMLELKPN